MFAGHGQNAVETRSPAGLGGQRQNFYLTSMRKLERLFQNNRSWADRICRQEPDFFTKLSQQQAPEYLWIGCSDSRVPANEIVDLLPGELFVHRNIANLVVHTDLNCLSVIQFAVDLLKVRHVIVCGHYGCSGVRAALQRDRLGLSDNWLRHIDDVRQKHSAHLSRLDGGAAACNRLCELNVIEQVANVCQTTIARDAWQRGQELTVHGWVYGLQDGLLRDLNVTVTNGDEPAAILEAALAEFR
jgi:carbonic anhydrase